MSRKRRVVNYSEDFYCGEDKDDDDDYLPQDEEVVEYQGRSKRSRQSAAVVVNSSAPSSSSSSRKKEVVAAESSAIADFSSSLTLKSDHESRPIWIAQENLKTSDTKAVESELHWVVILEAFSPHYLKAYDFLVAIAEPMSRPQYIHKYKLTPYSLYAAVAISIDPEDIISTLEKLCKTNLPAGLKPYIRQKTCTFGRAKLVLKDNQFCIESADPDVLRQLLRLEAIASARVSLAPNSELENGGGFMQAAALEERKENREFTTIGTALSSSSGNGIVDEDDESDNDDLYDSSQTDENGSAKKGRKPKTVSFIMIQGSEVSRVKQAALSANFPLMEEYDFKNDRTNPTLRIDLRPSTKIRSYQEKSLSKMFGNGRARSGIIVLPCGAGKSLTGVTAASTIKKSTIILCINTASVHQWKEQILIFTQLPEKSICLFTSQDKDTLPPTSEACVVITTFSMACHTGKRAAEAEAMINDIKGREWGLMILDEVHVAPAKMFKQVLTLVNAHCKLGLTATLVREDGLIEDLNFLVGPKL